MKNTIKKITLLLCITALIVCLAACSPLLTLVDVSFDEEIYHVAVGTTVQPGFSVEAQLSGEPVYVTYKNGSIQILDADGEIVATKKSKRTLENVSIEWISEDSSVAVVDGDGTVKAVSEGTTVINVYISCGKESIDARVAVEAGIPVTQLETDEDVTMYVGEAKQLIVVITPEDATDQIIEFVSQDEMIAVVDDMGMVTAQSEGETEIIITSCDRFSDTQMTVSVLIKVQPFSSGSGSGAAMLQELLGLINTERAAQGLSPLKWSESLAKAASIRSQEITEVFDHVRPDGSSIFSLDSSIRGENIALGYSSAHAVYTAWMNSPGHRANIMNPSYTIIGMGYAYGGRHYWCQLFG